MTDILQKKLCPAYLISSKPCKAFVFIITIFTVWDIITIFFFLNLLFSLSVLQRCFPSLGKKGDVITVGDQETFNDGKNIRDAKDLVAGMK